MPYFCLPPVPAEWAAGLQLPVRGSAGGRGGWLWPMLVVVPMGWSWAFFLAQRCMVWQCRLATQAPSSCILTDHGAAPDVSGSGFALLAYCDNLNVAATDPAVADKVAQRAASHLRSLGFE
eukprot:1954248-Alexandrium_andersonii.AAC.1